MVSHLRAVCRFRDLNVDKVVIAVMAMFMTIGALDKALFDGRFGYGKEFVKGLDTMGPLTLIMVGVMCVAPALGAAVGPALSPFFLSIGSDPALVSGVLFGVDAGGFPLARALAQHPEAANIFGIGLCSTLASIIGMPLPFSLAMAKEESRPYIAKGIVAAIIASPLSIIGVGFVCGYDFMVVLRLGAPAFVVAVILAFFLLFLQKPTVRFFIVFGRVIVSIYCLLLAVAALQYYFPITIIPGMAKIEPQLVIIGEIGIMLAGAYPMVYFARRYFTKGLRFLASCIKTDETSMLGMLVCIANPLPMYTMIDSMSNRGKVLASAFGGPVLCMLGDHLGFMSAYYPEGITALIVGKTIAAVAALLIALGVEKISPSPEETK